MRKLMLPNHLPVVDTVGLALAVLIFMVPEARSRWLIYLVLTLYVYSAFWDLVDAHQRGQLKRTVREIYQDAKQSPQRTRFESVAFSIAAVVVLVKYF